MTSFAKSRFVFFFLVSILMVSTQASAADIALSRQGQDVVISANVQTDFAGSEATVTAPDASTIEIAVPGADFAVDGKRQLFRFEDRLIPTLSVSRNGNSGVLRFNISDKSAARVAEALQMTRSANPSGGASGVIITMPASLEASAQAIEGSRNVSISAVSDDIRASAPAVGTTASEASVVLASKPAAPSAVSSEASKTGAMTGSTEASTAAANSVSDVRPESEIPVFTSSAEVKKTAGAGLERLVITLFVICAILGATLFGLKRWAARRGKNIASPTKIQILTQHHLGPKKSLAIIQVAGEAILIGITDQNISMLKTLSLIDDEVPGLVPKNFSDELDREDDDSRSRAEQQLSDEGYETDNFAMRGLSEVRDMVSTRFGSRSSRKDV